jgi:hypothetical protein
MHSQIAGGACGGLQNEGSRGGRTRGMAGRNGVVVTAMGSPSVCVGLSRDCKSLPKSGIGKSGRCKRRLDTVAALGHCMQGG